MVTVRQRQLRLLHTASVQLLRVPASALPQFAPWLLLLPLGVDKCISLLDIGKRQTLEILRLGGLLILGKSYAQVVRMCVTPPLGALLDILANTRLLMLPGGILADPAEVQT